MAEQSAVLIDNTTVDSALRLLSVEEIQRRQDTGWCLRDISDLSCLSSLLDALIYFADLYVIPDGVLPSTSPITSSGSPAEKLRDYLKPLHLPTNWALLAEAAKEDVDQFMASDLVLREQVKVPSLGRGVYSFEKRPDGTLDVYPDRSTVSEREARLALQRAYLYLSASRSWSEQSLEISLPVWLSPERYLLARRFSPQAIQTATQHDSFNQALSGNLPDLIPTAPSLILLLDHAERERVKNNDFASFLVDQVASFRSMRDIHQLRDFFRDSLTHPMTRREVEEWANYKSLWDKMVDLAALVPVAGNFLEVLLKWTHEPAVKILGSLTGWQPNGHALLRSVVNECRYLQVENAITLVRKFFAAHEDEKDHYYAHQIGYCVNAFKGVLAGDVRGVYLREVSITRCI